MLLALHAGDHTRPDPPFAHATSGNSPSNLRQTLQVDELKRGNVDLTNMILHMQIEAAQQQDELQQCKAQRHAALVDQAELQGLRAVAQQNADLSAQNVAMRQEVSAVAAQNADLSAQNIAMKKEASEYNQTMRYGNLLTCCVTYTPATLYSDCRTSQAMLNVQVILLAMLQVRSTRVGNCCCSDAEDVIQQMEKELQACRGDLASFTNGMPYLIHYLEDTERDAAKVKVSIACVNCGLPVPNLPCR